MNGVNELGYLIIGVSDLEGWRGLSSSVLGLELVPGDSRSTTYLRMDEHDHWIELRNGGSDDLEVIGWEVPDAATLHAVAQRLENAGVRVRSGTRDEADQRRVVELIGFEDPAGIQTEVYYGQPINQRLFQPSRAISGFKTGNMGLGHLVVHQPDLEASLKFYTDLLGFQVSDVVGPAGKPDGGLPALQPAPPFDRAVRRGGRAQADQPLHAGVQLARRRRLRRDIARRQGTPILTDLGRHMNDHMVSFYMANPSQFAIEYGWGGRTIDESCWQVGRYDSVESIWATRS